MAVYDHAIIINGDNYTLTVEYGKEMVDSLPDYDHNFCMNGAGKRMAVKFVHSYPHNKSLKI